jgi:hypothetical protein
MCIVITVSYSIVPMLYVFKMNNNIDANFAKTPLFVEILMHVTLD